MSIQSSKESSNYNKIVCIASVIDTDNAPEKSNISANIRKKSKSLLGLSTGARRSCLKKKTRGEKSGSTVPLSVSSILHCVPSKYESNCATEISRGFRFADLDFDYRK